MHCLSLVTTLINSSLNLDSVDALLESKQCKQSQLYANRLIYILFNRIDCLQELTWIARIIMGMGAWDWFGSDPMAENSYLLIHVISKCFMDDLILFHWVGVIYCIGRFKLLIKHGEKVDLLYPCYLQVLMYDVIPYLTGCMLLLQRSFVGAKVMGNMYL